jgi:hypothetical protein
MAGLIFPVKKGTGASAKLIGAIRVERKAARFQQRIR